MPLTKQLPSTETLIGSWKANREKYLPPIGGDSMEMSRIAATFIVIMWLCIFSRAIINLIGTLLEWLIWKPVQQMIKLIFDIE